MWTRRRTPQSPHDHLLGLRALELGGLSPSIACSAATGCRWLEASGCIDVELDLDIELFHSSSPITNMASESASDGDPKSICTGDIAWANASRRSA